MLDETPGSATERQTSYIHSLAQKKDLSSDRLNDEQRNFLRNGDLSLLSKAQADKVIKLLLELDWASERTPFDLSDADIAKQEDSSVSGELRLPAEPTPVEGSYRGGQKPRYGEYHGESDELAQLEQEVRAARYFIVDPTNGEERFFKVSKGAEGGRWEGKTFLEVQASDYFYPVKDAYHRLEVYKEIQKDPVNAMNLYGMKLGVCGVCGRTLTDRDSILRGIGPICARNLMMEEAQATPEQQDMLRNLGLKKD